MSIFQALEEGLLGGRVCMRWSTPGSGHSLWGTWNGAIFTADGKILVLISKIEIEVPRTVEIEAA